MTTDGIVRKDVKGCLIKLLRWFSLRLSGSGSVEKTAEEETDELIVSRKVRDASFVVIENQGKLKDVAQ